MAFSCKSPSPYEYKLPANVSSVISTENPMTVEGVKLGRYLFYEKLLSRDNTISCNSCHIQKYAFTDHRVKAIGIGGSIGTFNSMTLTNVLLAGKLQWEGRGKSLEKQALAPIVNHLEMDQRLSMSVKKLKTIGIYKILFKNAFGSSEITPQKIAYAISQFERSLISFNSKYDQYLKKEITFSKLESDGLNLFFSTPEPHGGTRGGGCINCHLPMTFAGSPIRYEGFKNNGLNKSHYKDQQGRHRISHLSNDYGKFKVPTLRNIEYSYPYMHDGRFATLEEVLNHYSENIIESKTLDTLLQTMTNDLSEISTGLHLTDYEKKAIIAFLKTLTDKEFLTNPEFSNPKRTIEIPQNSD